MRRLLLLYPGALCQAPPSLHFHLGGFLHSERSRHAARPGRVHLHIQSGSWGQTSAEVAVTAAPVHLQIRLQLLDVRQRFRNNRTCRYQLCAAVHIQTTKGMAQRATRGHKEREDTCTVSYQLRTSGSQRVLSLQETSTGLHQLEQRHTDTG